MLGVGDFYYELGVQIVEVCLATSHRNGGKESYITHNVEKWIERLTWEEDNPMYLFTEL